MRGNGRLRDASNSPSSSSFCLSWSKASCSAPCTLRLDGLHDELVFAALFVDIDAAAHQHLDAVFRLELQTPVA